MYNGCNKIYSISYKINVTYLFIQLTRIILHIFIKQTKLFKNLLLNNFYNLILLVYI